MPFLLDSSHLAARPILFAATAVILLGIACQPAQAADKGKCDPDRIQSEIEKAEAKFNDKELRRKAEATGEFKDKIKGHQVEFNSVYSTWSFDPATCNGLTLKDVNVVHSMRAEGEKESTTNLISHFDPDGTRLDRISQQKAQRRYGSYAYNMTNYAGYFAGNAHTTAFFDDMTSVMASFNVPKLSNPYSLTKQTYSNCFDTYCEFSIWIGMKESIYSGSIAQTGVASQYACDAVYVTAYCWTEYEPFYEFYPAAPVYCGGTMASGTSAGDLMWAHVDPYTPTGFSMYLYNLSDGTLCASKSSDFTMTARFGAFIGERPLYVSNDGYTYYRPLPKFTTVSFTSPYVSYANEAEDEIAMTPYDLGNNSSYDVVKTTMQNGGKQNIETGSLNSTGDFTLKWLTSVNAGRVRP
jgi:hypothetical protein